MRVTPAFVMLFMLAGCSTYDRDWKAAAAGGVNPSIYGAWTGRWQSDAGHGGGKLRCILTPYGPVHTQARYEATFWGFLRARYTILMTATKTADEVAIEGNEDLGLLAGGAYRYQGKVAPQSFSATYRSEHDRGTFNMARP